MASAQPSTLAVVTPTGDEEIAARILNQIEWRGALTPDQYLDREVYLGTIPLAANGGRRAWILTDPSLPPGERPILSSCETWKKTTLATQPGTTDVQEESAYGIGSVYTDPKYRGHGYASRLIRELGTRLQAGIESDEQGKLIQPAASVLWSDIGKTFYAKLGWKPHDSAQAVLPASQQIDKADWLNTPSGTITYDNLEQFANLDCNLLRHSMATEGKLGKRQFALLPDYDTIRWHLYRDDWITARVLPSGGKEEAKGAWAGQPGRRVWATWVRSFDMDHTNIAKNTLNVLRFTVEDEEAPEAELIAASASVVLRALEVATKWHLGSVIVWNPTEKVQQLLASGTVIFQMVDRQDESIPSLLLFNRPDERVEWVANEKYGWC